MNQENLGCTTSAHDKPLKNHSHPGMSKSLGLEKVPIFPVYSMEKRVHQKPEISPPEQIVLKICRYVHKNVAQGRFGWSPKSGWIVFAEMDSIQTFLQVQTALECENQTKQPLFAAGIYPGGEEVFLSFMSWGGMSGK
ncbi:MAG: hypothetical protein HQL52_07955 [Magnetococcales bacterium]|nr:hypothetical protein [Magnetococcales bacterium]